MYRRNVLNVKGFRASQPLSTSRSLARKHRLSSLSSLSPPFRSSLSLCLSLLFSLEEMYMCTCTGLCHGSGWVAVGISTGCLPPVCLLPFTAPSAAAATTVAVAAAATLRPPTPSSRQSSNRGTLHAITFLPFPVASLVLPMTRRDPRRPVSMIRDDFQTPRRPRVAIYPLIHSLRTC